MASSLVRPSFCFFANRPRREEGAADPFAVIQLDVEIPNYQPVSRVVVHVYYTDCAAPGRDTEWQRCAAVLVGRYPESRSTFLYCAQIRGCVRAWYAAARWGKGRPAFHLGSRAEPRRVEASGAQVLAPPYFTVGFASIRRGPRAATVSVLTNPAALDVHEGDVSAVFTSDKWNTQVEAVCRKAQTPEVRLASGQRAAAWSVDVPNEKLGSHFEICFRVRAAGTEFWDHNFGANYSLRRGFCELRGLWP